jgi:hypothetical protein
MHNRRKAEGPGTYHRNLQHVVYCVTNPTCCCEIKSQPFVLARFPMPSVPVLLHRWRP